MCFVSFCCLFCFVWFMACHFGGEQIASRINYQRIVSVYWIIYSVFICSLLGGFGMRPTHRAPPRWPVGRLVEKDCPNGLHAQRASPARKRMSPPSTPNPQRPGENHSCSQ